jgi:hypothetical protein
MECCNSGLTDVRSGNGAFKCYSRPRRAPKRSVANRRAQVMRMPMAVPISGGDSEHSVDEPHLANGVALR